MMTSTTTTHLRDLGKRVLEAGANQHEFVIKTKPVKKYHTAQLTLDIGFDPGPWAVIGFNETEFCLGYLPPSNRPEVPTTEQLLQ